MQRQILALVELLPGLPVELDDLSLLLDLVDSTGLAEAVEPHGQSDRRRQGQGRQGGRRRVPSGPLQAPLPGGRPAGEVVEEVRRGYLLNNRVFRCAEVRVARN